MKGYSKGELLIILSSNANRLQHWNDLGYVLGAANWIKEQAIEAGADMETALLLYIYSLGFIDGVRTERKRRRTPRKRLCHGLPR